MKTKDAFAFRDFDADIFISNALDACGLNLTPDKLLGAVSFGHVDFAALGVDTADINSLQDARRKFFALQTRLDDFIRRIIRHVDRLDDWQRRDTIAQLRDWKREDFIAGFRYSAIKEPSRNVSFGDLFLRYNDIAKAADDFLPTTNLIIIAIDAEQKKYYRKIFAQRLRQARKAKGMKQSEVAAQIGLNQNSYSAYEQKRNLPTAAMLGVLCRVLDTTPNKLLDF